MSVTIENLTNRLVLLPLNSGQTLHLAPRMTSAALLDVEVAENAKVEKLQGRHEIVVHRVEKREDAPTADGSTGDGKKKAEATKAGDKKPAVKGE